MINKLNSQIKEKLKKLTQLVWMFMIFKMIKWYREEAFKVVQAKINISLLHKAINQILRFKRKILFYKIQSLRLNKIQPQISILTKNY
jgi:hypothetical protein